MEWSASQPNRWSTRKTGNAASIKSSNQQPNHANGDNNEMHAMNSELKAGSDNWCPTDPTLSANEIVHSQDNLGSVTGQRTHQKRQDWKPSLRGQNWKPSLKAKNLLPEAEPISNSTAARDWPQEPEVRTWGRREHGPSDGNQNRQSGIVRNMAVVDQHVHQLPGQHESGHRSGANGPRRKAEQQPIGAEAVVPPPQEQTLPPQGEKENVLSSQKGRGQSGSLKHNKSNSTVMDTAVGASVVPQLLGESAGRQGEGAIRMHGKAKQKPVGARAREPPEQSDSLYFQAGTDELLVSRQGTIQSRSVKPDKNSVSAKVQACEDRGCHKSLQSVLPAVSADSLEDVVASIMQAAEVDEQPGMQAVLDQQGVQDDVGPVTFKQPLDPDAMVESEAVQQDAELFLNTCALCGATQMLVIDGGVEFVCEEAGRPCNVVVADPKQNRAQPGNAKRKKKNITGKQQVCERIRQKENVYSASKSEFGEIVKDVVPQDIQVLDAMEEPCSASNAMSDALGMPADLETAEVPTEACHVSSEPPPSELRMFSSDGTHDESEMFLNTCARCGETRLLLIDGGEDFVCEEAGEACSKVVIDASNSTNAATAEEVEDTAEEMSLRRRLLQEVLANNLTVLAAADLFLSQGEQPPSEMELKAEKEGVQRQAKERHARDQVIIDNAAWRASQKKQQRYLDGQLVEVQRGSKFLVEPKESVADKAKTSVAIPILGTRRAVTGEKAKKGPRS